MQVYINVKNFGKIREARVNISNFTIFVGNNNSGKTQLMELIYTVIKHVSGITPNIEMPQIDEVDGFWIGYEEIRSLNQWVNNYLSENIKQIIDETFNASIPIEAVWVELEEIDVSYDIYLLTDRTIEYLQNKNLITQEELTESVLNGKSSYGTMVFKNGILGGKSQESSSVYSRNIPIEIAKKIEIGQILAEIIGGDSPEASNTLFLPASRMGLMQLYKHYFGNTNQNKEALVYEKNQNSKGITQPVLDFLSFLLQYSYTEREAKRNEELLDFISENLIDGRISERGEATIYTPKNENKEIPIYVASSMVNEVVPIIKALTDSGRIDFIFYDEVETSMHPLKQIEMVKLLNRLNNKGIRLIVSTHSDTMATKINNLMLLSHGDLDFATMQKALAKKGVSISKEDLLNSSNIHVYQFLNEESGKSVVSELEFKKVPCTGYDFSLFNDSTMNLFEEAKIAMGVHDED